MRKRRTGGVRRTEDQWAEILRRFHSGGLGSKEFCRREGVPLSSLQRWRLRLGPIPEAKFVELVPPAPSVALPAIWCLEVSLPNGACLRFRA
jgi:hypothetical protein